MMHRTILLVSTWAVAGLLLGACGDDDSTVNPICGDGVIEGDEVCDDAELGYADCGDLGFTAGILACAEDCLDFDTAGCFDEACGNGALEGNEICDGSDLRGATCEDFGYLGGSLACDTSCALDTAGCRNHECGNDVAEGDERCDGVDLGYADCVDLGFAAGTLACGATCLDFDTSGCCDDGCSIDGDTQCTGDTLRTCEVQANGCLDWTDLDCTNDNYICDDAVIPAACRPACLDECQTDGELRCDGGTLSLCSDSDNNGCLDLTLTDCLATPGQVCDDSLSPAACAANGSGDACVDAYAVQDATAQLTGADFTADFTDAHSWSGGTDCVSAATGAVEAVFEVQLEANDTVVVSEHDSLDVVLRIVAADPTGCLVENLCLVSADLGLDESGGIQYATTAAETVYAIVESWSANPVDTAYDVLVQVIPQVCGDGLIGPSEGCDDGNTSDSDGCSAACAVEAGFDCVGAPSYCYAQGAGDVCATPIPVSVPSTLQFDTTGFTDDYGEGVGSTYAACSGSEDGGYGPDVVFAAEVDAGELLEVTADPDFTGALIITTDCADIEGSCVSYDEGSNLLQASHYNDTGATQTVFVVIDSGYSSTNQAGPVELTFSTRVPLCGDGVIEGGEQCDDGNGAGSDGCSAACAVEGGFDCIGAPSFCYPTGAGDVCAVPILVSVPSTLQLDTAGFADDYGEGAGSTYAACSGTEDGGYGPDIVLSADVDAGELLEVTADPDFSGALIIATDCANIEGSCVSYDEGSNLLQTSHYNDTGATQTVFVVIDSGYSTSSQAGPVALTFSTHVPVCGDGTVEGAEQCDDGNGADSDGCSAACAVEAGFECIGAPSFCYPQGAGDTCAFPIVITSSIAIEGDTSTYNNDYTGNSTYDGGACSTPGTSNAPDTAYSITLADSETVTATLTGESYDALIALTTDCLTLTACLDLGDDPENVTHTNTTGAPQTVYLLIDGYSTASGTYDLSITIN